MKSRVIKTIIVTGCVLAVTLSLAACSEEDVKEIVSELQDASVFDIDNSGNDGQDAAGSFEDYVGTVFKGTDPWGGDLTIAFGYIEGEYMDYVFTDVLSDGLTLYSALNFPLYEDGGCPFGVAGFAKDNVDINFSFDGTMYFKGDQIEYEYNSGSVMGSDKEYDVEKLEESAKTIVLTKSDETYEPTTMSAEMGNPWSETEDLNEAIEGSGVSVSFPADDAIPAGMTFTVYRYMDEMIEANYAGDDDEMDIRASKDYEEENLSGDYTEYSKTWDEDVDGVQVSCKGSGDKATTATFTKDDVNFAISVNIGDEERGLSLDELKVLVEGLEVSAE